MGAKQKKLAILAALIIVLIFILAIFSLGFKKKRFVTNGVPYRVLNNRRNKKTAMYILDTLNNMAIGVADSMDKKYKTDNSLAREAVDLIIKNYNPDLLVENDPLLTYGDKTYTMDQKRISICLRKLNGTFYDMNTLTFVFLHELSHVGTPKRYVDAARDNHPKMFWAVFKFILNEAIQAGFYLPIEYSSSNIVHYCGVDIVDNPYYDKTLADIRAVSRGTDANIGASTVLRA
jgi:hypothetical protein